MERWWDGSAWTEYTRTAPVPPAYPGYPAAPDYVGYGPGAGGPGGRRTGTVVIALVASLVLIGAIVAGVLVLGKDDNKNDDAKSSPTPTHTGGRIPGPAPQPSDGGSGGDDGGDSGGSGNLPPSDGKSAVDGYDAISLPVLDGWTGRSGRTGSSISYGPYTCPGTSGGTCSLGGASAEPALAEEITATTAEAAAKEDIAKNAAASYNKDTYGATTSHQQLKAGAATVAGQQGYFVRWQVTTASGTKGYVESLVFPSPSTKQLVLVRFGFDITAKAPGVGVIDQIVQGIKTDTSLGNGSTGGTGTGV